MVFKDGHTKRLSAERRKIELSNKMPPNPFAALGIDSDEEGEQAAPTVPKSSLRAPPAYIPLMTPPAVLSSPSRVTPPTARPRCKREDTTAPTTPTSGTPSPAGTEPAAELSPAAAATVTASATPPLRKLCILRGLPGRSVPHHLLHTLLTVRVAAVGAVRKCVCVCIGWLSVWRIRAANLPLG
jgi:hypothetical protein